ncbi:MAG: YlzJ-like family protein [Dethiobacteria bacterium]
MIIYTTIPLEEIFKESADKTEYLQLPYSKGIIEVELISASKAKIVRLISHDLNDYLQPRLQPGTEIRLKWEIDR